VLEQSDAVHAAANAVARIQAADARGRPREDEVAGHQLEPGGELRDDLGHPPDHVGDVAVLAQLAINLEPDAATCGMADA